MMPQPLTAPATAPRQEEIDRSLPYLIALGERRSGAMSRTAPAAETLISSSSSIQATTVGEGSAGRGPLRRRAGVKSGTPQAVGATPMIEAVKATTAGVFIWRVSVLRELARMPSSMRLNSSRSTRLELARSPTQG